MAPHTRLGVRVMAMVTVAIILMAGNPRPLEAQSACPVCMEGYSEYIGDYLHWFSLFVGYPYHCGPNGCHGNALIYRCHTHGHSWCQFLATDFDEAYNRGDLTVLAKMAQDHEDIEWIAERQSFAVLSCDRQSTKVYLVTEKQSRMVTRLSDLE